MEPFFYLFFYLLYAGHTLSDTQLNYFIFAYFGQLSSKRNIFILPKSYQAVCFWSVISLHLISLDCTFSVSSMFWLSFYLKWSKRFYQISFKTYFDDKIECFCFLNTIIDKHFYTELPNTWFFSSFIIF